MQETQRTKDNISIDNDHKENSNMEITQERDIKSKRRLLEEFEIFMDENFEKSPNMGVSFKYVYFEFLNYLEEKNLLLWYSECKAKEIIRNAENIKTGLSCKLFSESQPDGFYEEIIHGYDLKLENFQKLLDFEKAVYPVIMEDYIPLAEILVEIRQQFKKTADKFSFEREALSRHELSYRIFSEEGLYIFEELDDIFTQCKSLQKYLQKNTLLHSQLFHSMDGILEIIDFTKKNLLKEVMDNESEKCSAVTFNYPDSEIIKRYERLDTPIDERGLYDFEDIREIYLENTEELYYHEDDEEYF